MEEGKEDGGGETEEERIADHGEEEAYRCHEAVEDESTEVERRRAVGGRVVAPAVAFARAVAIPVVVAIAVPVDDKTRDSAAIVG